MRPPWWNPSVAPSAQAITGINRAVAKAIMDVKIPRFIFETSFREFLCAAL
jgi:hypothetical protein